MIDLGHPWRTAAVTDSTLASGGKVIGVLPDFLTAYEIKHPHIDHIMVPDLY